MANVWYWPVTPGGTDCIYGAGNRMGEINAARTKEKAIANLLEDAAHMPYGTWENFQRRGYQIVEIDMPKGWKP